MTRPVEWARTRRLRTQLSRAVGSPSLDFEGPKVYLRKALCMSLLSHVGAGSSCRLPRPHGQSEDVDARNP